MEPGDIFAAVAIVAVVVFNAFDHPCRMQVPEVEAAAAARAAAEAAAKAAAAAAEEEEEAEPEPAVEGRKAEAMLAS